MPSFIVVDLFFTSRYYPSAIILESCTSTSFKLRVFSLLAMGFVWLLAVTVACQFCLVLVLSLPVATQVKKLEL